MKPPNNGIVAKNDSLERFVVAVGIVIALTGSMAWAGLKRIKFRSSELIIFSTSLVLLIFAVTYGDYAYLKALHWIWPNLFTAKFTAWLKHWPKWSHFLVLLTGVTYTSLCALGLRAFVERRKLQNNFNSVGLSNAKGEQPKILAVVPKDDERCKVIVRSIGVGVDRFEGKKSDLEYAFGQMVEQIEPSPDRRTIEISLCKRELGKMFLYEDLEKDLKSPFTFLVGASVNGTVTQDIRDLPHLLIAGTSGGGKSVFECQLLVCLGQWRHIQFYLIDLKHGVELKEFGHLPNVRIAKDEVGAVKMLTAVRDEMKRRFQFMEEKGVKKIEPSIHKKDLIVVAIDEASVLFGKTTVSKSKADLVARARELTDELAKLSRAAAIHLVIATQKPIKESLDTKTLENLSGRMVFKMSTLAGSTTALGNIKAYSLPDIKGRAVWAGGNKFVEVQAPFLSEEALELKIQAIAKTISDDKSWNFQSMLELSAAKSQDANEFSKNTVKGRAK